MGQIPFDIVFLLVACTAFLGWVAWITYARSGDILHPGLFLSFLFFTGMVVEPWQRLAHEDIVQFFPGYDGVAGALLIQYLGVFALFIGLLSVHVPKNMRRKAGSLVDRGLTDIQRERLRKTAWAVGLIAVGAFWSGIFNAGGLTRAYGSVKGGGVTLSGYLGEAQNLGFAAVVMYALGWQRKKFTYSNLFVMVLFISPTLIHGTLGGRRGPLFISLVALFAGWVLIRGRMPRLKVLMGYFSLVILAVVFVQSQRQHLYLGSRNAEIKLEQFKEVLAAKEIQEGDNFMASTGCVLVARKTGEYHFGRRFFITFFIRPIPRQIWPTKYEDVSSLLYGRNESYFENIALFNESDWNLAVGWHPPSGYATNSIVDLFMEFSWLYVVALFFLGKFIGFLWLRFRTRGGVWNILFMASAVLSIYLPTQSFSAFAHRFLFIAVGAWLFWKWWVKKREFGGRPSRRKGSRNTVATAQR